MKNITWASYKHDPSIVVLTIDQENSKVNVLNKAVLKDLKFVLNVLKEDKTISRLLIRSGKKTGFILGADIAEFDGVTGEEGTAFISANHEILRLIKDLPFTTIALVEGYALGGGAEFALMCDYIIAANDPGTRIGLPEVTLGIQPGYGGNYNTINRMGDFAAMSFMLSGKAQPARVAIKTGLIDGMVLPSGLIDAGANFKEFVRKPKGLILGEQARGLLAKVLRKQVAKKANPKFYPAPYALIDHWVKYGADEDVHKDSVAIQKLFDTPEARGLIRCFNLQNTLKKLPLNNPDNAETKFKRVHVVGAGVMGADIASWCAVKGFQVTLHDINKETLGKAVKSAHKTMNKIRAYDAKDRFTADITGEGARDADIIIEAVLEDLKIKTMVLKNLESMKKPSAILASNTSSIMIEELQSHMDKPDELMGLHFFNPVSHMQLVEIVIPETYNKDVFDKLVVFTKAIGKLPLPVKSHPGFLVNRVLMPYMIKAFELVEQGISPEIIDQAALDFGMPIGPLALGDVVGLDIGLHVSTIFEEKLGEGYKVPQILKDKVAAGELGKKSGKGFFDYTPKSKWYYLRGKGRNHNGTILEEKGRNHNGTILEEKGGITQQEISDLLRSVFLEECRKVVDEGIVLNSDHLDAGIIFATGYCPSSGGPSKDL